MLLEKLHWSICLTEGCHKPSVCKECNIVKQNKAKRDKLCLHWVRLYSWHRFILVISLETREGAQSRATLCDPLDCSLPGSCIHGISLARVLEWVVIPFSRGSSWPGDRTQVSCIVGRRFIVWATREAPLWWHYIHIQVYSEVTGC